MNFIGISAGYHDAAVSITDEYGDILFAAHSERYSKKKHDELLCEELIIDAKKYITSENISLNYYERPWLKFLRQLRTGESFNINNINSKNIIGKKYIKEFNCKIKNHSHHLSHAAAGFQTSPFEKATIVVIDAIGEFETITIWAGKYVNNMAVYKKLWSRTYPNSIGLYYSAMTDRVGLNPRDEEYILMGMAGWGTKKYENVILNECISDLNQIKFKKNLHLGIEDTFLYNANIMDIASSSQAVVELLINNVMSIASKFNWSNNLVYSGGVALNCLANRNLNNYFERIWIMPNPGDAGSSLGAAALSYRKKINWKDAYLGHKIEGDYPISNAIQQLLNHQIVGVANGRAEFGPRALGNRSLLADPRDPTIKDRVNEIKRRQKFRPFAPAILEEHYNDYFSDASNWVDKRYMQIVARCKHPEKFPSIVHVDGTSRIQVVPKDGSGIRHLLEKWYTLTNCPMLLNTSLNVRGEPMVNDRSDADRFEQLYNIKVVS